MGAKETAPAIQLGSMVSQADALPIELAGPRIATFLFREKNIMRVAKAPKRAFLLKAGAEF